MPPQLSALRKFPGIIRVATLLLGILGLIFIIVALSLHSSREYVGYEASFYAFISVTSVSGPRHPFLYLPRISLLTRPTVRLDHTLVHKCYLCPPLSRPVPSSYRHRV